MKRNQQPQRNPERQNHALFADGNYRRFLRWISTDARRGVSLKLAYVDVVDDLVGGILLAQILYWFSPDKKDRQPRVRVMKLDRYWVAKRRTDWFEQCRITENQYDRAIRLLINKGLVTVENHKFDGTPMPHISVNWDTLATELEKVTPLAPANGKSTETKVEEPLPSMENPDLEQKSKSITKELLSKTSSEVNNTIGDVVPHFREENKDHGTTQHETCPSPVAPPGHEEVEALVKEFLTMWQAQFPGQVVTETETRAVQELIQLGLVCHVPESLVDRFIRLASKQGTTEVQALLDYARPFLQDRAQVLRLARLTPGTIGEQDRKLILLLSGWASAFRSWFECGYHFEERDLKAARDFLADDPGVEVGQVVDIAVSAWEDSEKPEPKGRHDPHWFSRKKARPLNSFLKFYEKISQEVNA